MNDLLTDNTVSTLRSYLTEKLMKVYEEREAMNIVNELFFHYKKWDRLQVSQNLSSRLSESEILKFHFALKRLVKGEPLQYITGIAYFYGLELEVNNAVLIPRPETEELVQLVLDKNKLSSPRILDIGTGSGCIPLTLKSKLPASEIVAIDISEQALEIAKRNAAKHSLEIEFLQHNVFEEIPGNRKFDIIVSNPPYVLESDKSTMIPQVLEHEPHLALFVEDSDALKYYRRIFDIAITQLNPGGWVACEMHESKEEEMKALLEEMNIPDYSFHQDLQGKIRMVSFSI